MNKILFLVLFAVSAMMFACGSQDGSPPELKNSQVGYISPFDTLVAEFDSKILLSELNDENFTFSSEEPPVLVTKKEGSSNKLQFVGSYGTTPGGLAYFKPNVNRGDSIVFLNLKNIDGYVQKRAVIRFNTERILDDIDDPSNYEIATARDIDTLGDATIEKIVFAGVLDHHITGNVFNTEDFYKLLLRTNDIFTMTIIANNDSLSVDFTEPGRNSVNQTFSAKKGVLKEFTYTIGSGHLDVENGDPSNKLVPFYIRVYDQKGYDPPNPYIISISVERPR